MRVLIAAAVFAAAVATAAWAASITDDQVAALKIGTTTYDQVVSEFGRPTTITQSSDGRRIIVYSSVQTHVKASTYVPVFGLFAGGAKANTDVHQFEFGPDGLLARITSSNTAVQCKVLGGCGSQ